MQDDTLPAQCDAATINAGCGSAPATSKGVRRRASSAANQAGFTQKKGGGGTPKKSDRTRARRRRSFGYPHRRRGALKLCSRFVHLHPASRPGRELSEPLTAPAAGAVLADGWPDAVKRAADDVPPCTACFEDLGTVRAKAHASKPPGCMGVGAHVHAGVRVGAVLMRWVRGPRDHRDETVPCRSNIRAERCSLRLEVLRATPPSQWAPDGKHTAKVTATGCKQTCCPTWRNSSQETTRSGVLPPLPAPSSSPLHTAWQTSRTAHHPTSAQAQQQDNSVACVSGGRAKGSLVEMRRQGVVG